MTCATPRVAYASIPPDRLDRRSQTGRLRLFDSNGREQSLERGLTGAASYCLRRVPGSKGAPFEFEHVGVTDAIRSLIAVATRWRRRHRLSRSLAVSSHFELGVLVSG
jgi:hypothetical protein